MRHRLPPAMRLKEESNKVMAQNGVEPLRGSLKDENADVRMFAAMTLYELGSQALAARPDLEKAASDSNPTVRFWAKHALARRPDAVDTAEALGATVARR